MYLTRKNINFYWKIAHLSCPLKLDGNFVQSVAEYSQEIQPLSPIKDPSSNESSTINGRGVIFFLSLPILFLIIGFLVKKSYQKLSKNKYLTLSYHPKIPCRKCHFFNENHYLKCAVNPNLVLKEEAQDCSDYQKEK